MIDLLAVDRPILNKLSASVKHDLFCRGIPGVLAARRVRAFLVERAAIPSPG